MERVWDCGCIEHAFEPLLEVDDVVINFGRRPTRGVGEDGLPDRPGGRALVCSCCDFPGGPYVPLCPFRAHAGTGLARGDIYPRLRRAWNVRHRDEEGMHWPEPPSVQCQ